MSCLGPLEHPEIRAEASKCLKEALQQTRDRIARVPIDPPSEILQASPFQTYVRLRELIGSAVGRVEVFDPYLDDVVYHRYLSGVDGSVNIVVVTTSENLGVGGTTKRALARRDRIVSVSEILAAERPSSYRLLAASGFHDRHLRIDGSVLHLGGSLKDASRSDPFTISALATDSAALLDQLVATADEWFGPTSSVHRRE